MITGVLETHGTLRARLLSDIARHFGAPVVRVDSVAVSTRPFSTVTRLRVVVDDGVKREHGAYVKVFRPEVVQCDRRALVDRVAREYAVLSRVHQALQGAPCLGVVPPIACYPEELTNVTEEVAGATLLEHARRCLTWWGSPSLADEAAVTMRTAGRWIGALQGVEGPGTPWHMDEISTYLDQRLARLVGSGRIEFSQGWRARVLAHLGTLGRHLAEEDRRSYFAHADMSLVNALVHDGRVIVLDFAMARQAPRLHDLTRLHVQLDLLAVKPYIRLSAVRAAQLALMRGFDPGLQDRHPLFRILTLLHRVNHLGTLTLKPERFPQSLYNSLVARAHRGWIDAELQRGLDV